jgi:hypothetical protein
MEAGLIKRYLEIGNGLPLNNIKVEEVTLSEAGALKIMADRFFLDMVIKKAEEFGKLEDENS